MGIYNHRTIKRKVLLSKLSKKIKRLVKIHKKVKLEVYNSGRNSGVYGMRYLSINGSCDIHYVDDNYNDDDSYSPNPNGRSKQSCCFFDEYSNYTNDNGNEIVIKSLDDTLRAMQQHDRRSYRVKFIHAGGRKIKC